ncbi:DNA polymerase III subunit gamma/tau [Blastochloris tepida]|uniref:DNA polymerase III subunit gamma/tau n=1 Tax=Blastochloris tepida TaxID=2233851 RepID=A0A348G5N5_9HYPH|nr:DNA polymerase III subunit gamma/tau [Blastochloris tepida]BBF94868.1 DNA polymerase III subunit gamma/tau [Blastochloris tepida]
MTDATPLPLPAHGQAPAGPETALQAGVPPPAAAGYRVLARKYRPQRFEDLIGQEAMVRTIGNAFSTGRIPQAWILTGVRGVGKTTTARILARALNYEAPGVTGPTIELPAEGVHCRAIMESRHVDVIEIDAASHNGVADIRELTDNSRYRPVSARMKVYIVDEVHMLSTAAFNALLKTLEEPPEHVKFIFATTEIRKVPVTVLSRCQRFDLRRIEGGVLVRHLAGICDKEGVAAEPEALAVIARAAEGSVRDSLSLLDQAIAHGAGRIEAEAVRTMLGLADRARIIDLYEALMRGNMAAALSEFRAQYDAGADPASILVDLADFTHLVTRVKIVPAVADDPALVEAERRAARELAGALSMRVLGRAWQMLSKGIAEVNAAARPVQAAEMVLVRIAYAADLPTPDEALRRLAELANGNAAPSLSAGPNGGARAQLVAPVGGSIGGPVASALARPSPQAEAGIRLETFEELVALAASRRDILLKTQLETGVRLVAFQDGRLEIALAGASPSIIAELGEKLRTWTGRRWVVTLSREGGGQTLAEKRAAEHARMRHDISAHPAVRAVMEHFPGAEIVEVRRLAPEPPAPGDGPDGRDPDDMGLDGPFADPDEDDAF